MNLFSRFEFESIWQIKQKKLIPLKSEIDRLTEESNTLNDICFEVEKEFMPIEPRADNTKTKRECRKELQTVPKPWKREL